MYRCPMLIVGEHGKEDTDTNQHVVIVLHFLRGDMYCNKAQLQ